MLREVVVFEPEAAPTVVVVAGKRFAVLLEAGVKNTMTVFVVVDMNVVGMTVVFVPFTSNRVVVMVLTWVVELMLVTVATKVVEIVPLGPGLVMVVAFRVAMPLLLVELVLPVFKTVEVEREEVAFTPAAIFPVPAAVPSAVVPVPLLEGVTVLFLVAEAASSGGPADGKAAS